MPKNSPQKISKKSIASVNSLYSALSINSKTQKLIESLPSESRYKLKEEIPKKGGGVRRVFNPHQVIRKIQSRINERIMKTSIDWQSHIYGSIPNQPDDEDGFDKRDYIACAQRHCGAKSILKIDIENFFDNIHFDLVEEIFVKVFKYPPEVSKELATICTYEERVPQGALTSSYIANLVLFDVEASVVTKLSRKGLIYTRLVDDITVSSKSSNYDFSYALRIIEDMLVKKELPVNREKTRVMHASSEPLTVHGLRVSFKQPRLPAQEVANIRAETRRIEQLASDGSYRTSEAYRKAFNKGMGRVNKLSRVKHNQHEILYNRLVKILPLPSKNDIPATEILLCRLESEFKNIENRKKFWYSRRYFKIQEKVNILNRSFPSISTKFRERLKIVCPEKK